MEMVPHIVALVADNLHCRLLDEREPLERDPWHDPDAASEYLARRETGMKILGGLLDVEAETEVIDDLVNFSATLIQMWAEDSGRDAFTILQEFALRERSGD
jgi:hypothetical protein